MEKFLQAAAIAWNPLGELRRRVASGTLTFTSVLVPFVGVVIACNLFALGAQKFFWQSVLASAGAEYPNTPLMNSEYFQRVMSAVGVLAPAGIVALLPERLFRPQGRSATLAAMLVVAAGYAFYAAAIGVPLYLTAGVIAATDAEAGLRALVILTIPMSLVLIALALFFWLRATRSVLGLTPGQITAITLAAVLPGLVIVGLLLAAAQASGS